MRIIISLSSKYKFGCSIYGDPQTVLWAYPLWITGSTIPWLPVDNTETFETDGVMINGKLCEKIVGNTNAEKLQNIKTTIVSGIATWCQLDNLLILRFRLDQDVDNPTSATAGEWFFPFKSYNKFYNYSRDQFIYDKKGKPVEPYILSKYTNKQTAELFDYSALTFNSASFKIMRQAFSSDFINFGNYAYIKDENDTMLDKMIVTTVSHDIDTTDVSCKDIRSSFIQKVINQQFDRNLFKNSEDIIIMSEDTDKKWKQDAIGYCKGVAGVIVNDYAFATGNSQFEKGYRYIRFNYGTFRADTVEVEGDKGWFELKGSYSTVTYKEQTYNGITQNVMYLKVNALVTNPSKSGENDPDYEGTGRNIRVTGVFTPSYQHAKGGGFSASTITRPFEILRYILNFYSDMEWTATWFNISEITGQLAVLNNSETGLVITQPTDIFRVLAELQAGSMYGWQLFTHKGLLTAKVHTQTAVRRIIPYEDIANIYSLKETASMDTYTSTIIINYAKNWSEDTYTMYSDPDTEREVLGTVTMQKTKTITTLLRKEADAIRRYENEKTIVLGVVRTIEHIELTSWEQYKDVQIYDMAEIDFGNLTENRIWTVLSVDLNYADERVTIGVYTNGR